MADIRPCGLFFSMNPVEKTCNRCVCIQYSSKYVWWQNAENSTNSAVYVKLNRVQFYFTFPTQCVGWIVGCHIFKVSQILHLSTSLHIKGRQKIFDSTWRQHFPVYPWAIVDTIFQGQQTPGSRPQIPGKILTTQNSGKQSVDEWQW